MAQQQTNKDNSGALFKNDKKQHENQPDYTGQATIGGLDFWMSAWIKQAPSGRKYFSFSFTEKQAPAQPQRPAQQPQRQQQQRSQSLADMDNDPPF